MFFYKTNLIFFKTCGILGGVEMGYNLIQYTTLNIIILYRSKQSFEKNIIQLYYCTYIFTFYVYFVSVKLISVLFKYDMPRNKFMLIGDFLGRIIVLLSHFRRNKISLKNTAG